MVLVRAPQVGSEFLHSYKITPVLFIIKKLLLLKFYTNFIMETIIEIDRDNGI